MRMTHTLRICYLLVVCPLFLSTQLVGKDTPQVMCIEYEIGGITPGPVPYPIAWSRSTGVTFKTDGAQWLTASLSSPRTPSVLRVSVKPVGLAAGVYLSDVRVSLPSVASHRRVSVRLTVKAAAGTIPKQPGDKNPGVPIPLTVAASNGGNFLAVRPASAVLPATLNVFVSPVEPDPDTYNGPVPVTVAQVAPAQITAAQVTVAQVTAAQVTGVPLTPKHSLNTFVTNKDVLTLAKAGFDEEFIIRTLLRARCICDTTSDAVASLAEQGVSQRVIEVMLAASRNAPPEGSASPVGKSPR